MDEQRKIFCWIGQRAIDCVGLHRYLSFDAAICCDYGDDAELIQNNYKIKIFSLEKALGIRRVWSNFTIDEAVNYYREYFNDKEITILPYKITDTLECLSKQSNGKIEVIAPQSQVVDLLDDKIYCFQRFVERDIAHPFGDIYHSNNISYENLRSKFGEKFVIRERKGASGNQTYIIENKEEFEHIKSLLENKPLLITEFVNGLSYNIHVVIDAKKNIRISAPSIQLVGIPESTNKKEVYCGNDFSAIKHMPQELIDKIYLQAQKISRWLLDEYNYIGVFGIDLIGDENRIVVLEINPRFQGSTALLTQSEILSGQIPTILSLFQDQDLANSYFPPQSYLQGAQLILHVPSDRNIEIKQSIPSGIYKLIDNEISYSRPGLSLSDCKVGEFLLTCGIPKKGLRIEQSASLAKIIMFNEMINIQTGGLNKDASIISRKVLALFEKSFNSL